MRFVRLACAVLLTTAATWTLATHFLRHVVPAPLNTESLAASINISVNGDPGDDHSFLDGTTDCQTHRRAERWRCSVPTNSGSGDAATYLVRRIDSGSCWVASIRQQAAELKMPARIDGCVRRTSWDWPLSWAGTDR